MTEKKRIQERVQQHIVTDQMNVGEKSTADAISEIVQGDKEGQAFLEKVAENINSDKSTNTEEDTTMGAQTMEEMLVNGHVAVIGFGQAGCNNAALAKKFGFLTGAVNTTPDDWGNLDIHTTYLVKDAQGTGKDPELAKELMKADIADIFKWFNGTFKSVKVIIVPFGTNGGTGSGMAISFCKILRKQLGDKLTILPAPMLGAIGEHKTEQKNLTRVVSELIEAKFNYVMFDNQLAIDSGSNSDSDTFTKVNHDFIGACRAVAREGIDLTNSGTMDLGDHNKLFIDNDRMIICRVDIDLSTGSKDIETQLIEGVQNSMQVKLADEVQPPAYGIYLNLPTEYHGNGSYDPLFSRFTSTFGKLNDELFKHCYSTDDSPYAYVFIPKAQVPVERLNRVQSRIREYDIETVELSLDDVDLVDTSSTRRTSNGSVGENDNTIDVDSINFDDL